MRFSEIKLPSNRSFGLLITIILFFISIYCLYLNVFIYFYFFCFFSFLFAIITYFSPNILLPLNKLWMRFGFIIGRLVNPIILSLLFFGIFTPIGYLTRIFGRDELNIIYKSEKTYWKYKKDKPKEHDSFNHQF